MLCLLEPVSRNHQEGKNGRFKDNPYERPQIPEIYAAPNPPAHRLESVYVQDQIIALTGYIGDFRYQFSLSQPC